jgi:GNAT superfamily N-acetyltransferase
VADSIAQQRQLAAWALLSHRYAVAGVVLLLAVMGRALYRGPGSLPLILTTSAGLVMAVLLGVRAAVGGYLAYAEAIGLAWLGDDEMVVTEHGPDLIGSLVFRVEGAKKRRGAGAGGRAVVRAWTVRRRERGRGIGRGLLEGLVAVCKERGCEGVAFAPDHAQTAAVLPRWVTWRVGDDERAARVLAEVETEGGLGQRRSR